MKAMEISRTGLDVEWRRLEIIADNLANLSTTRTTGGGIFQPRRLVSGPISDFAARLQGEGSSAPGGVGVYRIESANTAPRMVHQPGHPDADAKGFVAYPGTNVTDEMTLMIKTSRSYESNVVAMNMARQMYSKALELGKRS